MKIPKLLVLLLIFFNFCYAQTFKLKDIRVSGLQRITAGSFFNYMPIKRGDSVSDADYPEIIRELYKTGFFKDIKLARDGNVLIVNVEERPIIGEINISGNKGIKEKNLLEGLVLLDLGEGDFFDEMKLAEIEKELLNLYHSRSKFDVIIDASPRSSGQSRVALDINIQEGISARIRRINIVGNKAFSEYDLLSKIQLAPVKWYAFFSKNSQYSGGKLQADINTIETFYYDRGYLDFRVNSTQISLTDDKKDVYVTINLTEGLPYRIDSNDFADNKVLNKEKINDLLAYAIGDYYSRTKVRESKLRIENALGEKGYAFADVRVIPQLNKEHYDVALVYEIILGKKTYVRRIEFNGNYKTNDEVLRREMRQLESAPYNYTKLKRSDERINRLSYIKSVRRREVPVNGSPDQVDVIYEITEIPDRSFSGVIGYGDSSGLTFKLGYSTSNFFGTGNYFQFDFSTSKADKNYELKFKDPYFTVDGISRTLNLYYNWSDQSKIEIGDWSSGNAGVFVLFGFPINEYESVALGGGYRNTKIGTTGYVAPEITSYLESKGDQFKEFVIDFNWTHDTRDSAVFSTKGLITRFNAEVVTPGSTETYYKLSVRNRSYFQLSDKLLLSVRGDLSYGDAYGKSDSLPFFRNYYAGGSTTVRGFNSNSLGAKWDNGDIKGGAFRVTGGAEIILPLAFNQEAEVVRTGLFTDFGNVYSKPSDFDAKDFRYSAGAYLIWRSPIGPLNLSYGIPLNAKSGDDIERFQFSVGVPF